MATPLIVGIGVAAAAFGSKLAIQAYKQHGHKLASISLPVGSIYYRGGFESEMTKREALLILGLREGATKDKMKEAHRRIMLLNHPDRGGSPFIASKINEAKNLLDKQIRR